MSCGACNVCCVVFHRKELEKPMHELCSHYNNGCAIYSKRPKGCATFECGFLQGGWNLELRPDKCGVMIYKLPDGVKALQIHDAVSVDIMDKIKNIQSMGEKVSFLDGRKK